MRKYVLLSVLMLLPLGGCNSDSRTGLTNAELERMDLARKIRLVEASGELVLMVSGETITSDELIESPAELGGMYILPVEYFKPIARASELERFKEQVRDQLKEILTDKISDILLYQQAKRQIGKNIEQVLEKQTEKALREYVVSFGGDQIKADEALEKIGLDWTSFREHQKKLILAQWYLGMKLSDDRPVTYREVMEYYNQMKDEYFARPAIIRFRLIDIQPDRLAAIWASHDNHELARKIADRLLTRIESGEDFGELSKQYSHGPMRAFGGLWKPVQPGSLAPPYDLLAAESENIEPGQIASLIVANEHVFIMKLEEKQLAGYEPFEKVQRQVESKIIIDRRSEVIDRLNARLLQQAELSKTGEFIDFCLGKIYEMRDQTATVKRDIYKRMDMQKPRETNTSAYRDIGIPRRR